MKYFTKNELHAEIKGYMCAFANCLERVYFPCAGGGLLGLISKNPKMGIDDLKPEDVDVNKFYITRRLDELYEYGVNGQRDVYFERESDDDDAAFFLQGLDDFPLMYENTINAIPITLSRHACRMASARWALDEGSGMEIDDEGGWVGMGVITLSDVALLANMDEKSARNAANPKHKNHLKTFNNGARTYVRVNDAKEWLLARRGFKPTVIVDTRAERDLAKIGFFSKQDFGSYLRVQREKKGLAFADVANAIPDCDLTEEKLAELEQGKFYFDPVVFVGLAQLYELDTKAFVFAGLVLYQVLERERIEEQINRQIQA